MGRPSVPSSTAAVGSPSPVLASTPRLRSVDVALLGALGVLWGSAYIFIREGIVAGASPLLFASVRYVLSAAAFAGLALARREAFPGRRAVLVSAAVGGTLFIGLYGGLLYWGEQYTTGGYAAVLSSTAPILTVAVAYFLLPAERFGSLSLTGLLIGFVGVVVLVAPEITGSPVGSGWGPVFIVSAFLSTAIGTVLLRRIGGGRQGLWQIGVQFGVGGLILAVAAAVLPFPEALPDVVGVWAMLAALIVFSSVLGYFTYFTLHYRVGPVRANVVAYLLPLVAIGIGSGFFGEPVTAFEILGFLIVIAGVTLIVLESTRSSTHGNH